MKRPLGVAISTILMCIVNALGFFDINWQMPYAGALLLMFTVLIGLGYWVLWYYWRGKNWARWLVLVECLQCFWNSAISGT